VSVARVLIRRIVSANQNCRICPHVVNKSNTDIDSKFIDSKFIDSKFIDSKIIDSKFIDSKFIDSKFIV
jgi:hypothetical protein